MSATCTPVSRVRPGWNSSSLNKNQGLSPAACSTPLLAAFPGNDDEQERRQRRRSRVIDLQAANDSSFTDSGSHRWAVEISRKRNWQFVYCTQTLLSAWRVAMFVAISMGLLFILSSAVGTPAAVPKLSNAQISEHYSTCIKLSTENVSLSGLPALHLRKIKVKTNCKELFFFLILWISVFSFLLFLFLIFFIFFFSIFFFFLTF